MNRTQRIRSVAPSDPELWQKQYYRYPQQSRRRRLAAMKAICEGKSMIAVCRAQHIQRKTLEKWADDFLQGGFKTLLAPQRRPRRQTLTPERRILLRFVLLHQTPKDYGFDRYQWTAPLVQAWIQEKWKATLSTNRLYEIFDEMGLSHQRAHRDYGPYKPAERAAFQEELKHKVADLAPETALVALDEFALQSTPCTNYAWAEKNTTPALPSNENQREKSNGFLAVELTTGKTTVDFQPKAARENVVVVLALIILRYVQLGYRHILFLLDNCPIHNEAMQAELMKLLAEMAMTQGVTVGFWNTPVYSPAFNPAEYMIHFVRKNSLYHAPPTMTVQERAERIQSHLAQAPPQSPEQIKNLVRHICELPVGSGWF
jgi:transposase